MSEDELETEENAEIENDSEVENESDVQNEAEDSSEENVEDNGSDDAAEETPESSNDGSDENGSDENSSGPIGDLPPIESNYVDDELNDYFRSALTPVSDDQPCGADEDAASSVVSQIETTGDGIHEQLRVAFGEAVRDESMNSFDLASTGRDAEDLVGQIIECLEEKSKSLILASYLPHLMLIGHGLEGFAAGLDIFRELVERFPDHLYPQDREKVKTFLSRGVYVGNDDKVTDNYKLFLYLPVTEKDTLPYALLRNARLKGANTGVEGRYAGDAANSSTEFYVKLIGDLALVIEAAQKANAALAELLSEPMFEIVSFTFIESLQRMESIVTNLATENCPGYPPVEEEAAPEGQAGVAAASGGGAAMTGEIVNREQAIEMLRRIADFFHRTERHSPVSYRIRETIRFCKMDLPELLQFLLDGDDGPLDELQKRVGFKRHDSDSGEEYDG